MKLRYLATVVVLTLTTVAAHAQKSTSPADAGQNSAPQNIGLYFNPVFARVSNSNADSGAFAFLGQNSTSQVFYGYNFGVYDDFFHSGGINVGLDARFSDQHANNAMMREFLVGLRVSGKPFTRPFKPYLQASVGQGITKAPNSQVHVGKLDYAIFGGVDYTLAKHVDFRAIEIGYGSLTTASTATVGAGGNFPTSADRLLHFSTGLVFTF